jgi:hypothetical protein
LPKYLIKRAGRKCACVAKINWGGVGAKHAAEATLLYVSHWMVHRENLIANRN